MIPLPRAAASDLERESVARFLAECARIGAGLHSVMVVRRGRVTTERWAAPYSAAMPHTMFSVSKSVTATAMGLAEAEGLLRLDDAVASHFPSELPLAAANGMACLRIRDLLTMTTGQAESPADRMRTNGAENPVRTFFETPAIDPPGTRFRYNSGASRVLAELVAKTTGQSLTDYLTPRLWDPLGIDAPHWERTAGGVEQGATGLRLRTEDLAKLALLYLQGGNWDGAAILPANWTERATSAQVASVGDRPDWQAGYGFQFWRSTYGYRADGAFGQFAVVLPELDTVIALTAGASEPWRILELVWSTLLPSLSGEEQDAWNNAAPAPEFELAVPNYATPASASVRALSGKRLKLPANELGIAAVNVSIDDAQRATLHCELTDDRRVEVRAEPGSWTSGVGHWPHPEFDGSVTFARAGWTDSNRFEVTEVFGETAFTRRWVFELASDAGSVSLSVVTEPEFWQAPSARWDVAL